MLKETRQSGFTLTEVLVVVVILAVLAALALPSFKEIIVNTRIRATASAINDGLQLARAEAIRRNERVRFTLSADSGWTVITNGNTTLQTRPAAESGANILLTFTPNGSGSVTFNALGRAVANADGSAQLTQVEIDVPTSVLAANRTRELRVTIGTGGNIKLCDPSFATGDPRAC
jgi:type IV fimbrial biogenesis protein FimT